MLKINQQNTLFQTIFGFYKRNTLYFNELKTKSPKRIRILGFTFLYWISLFFALFGSYIILANWRNVKFGLMDSFTFVFLLYGIMCNLGPTFLSLGKVDRYYIRDVLGIASIPGILGLLGIGLFMIGFREFPFYDIIWPLLILVFLFLEVWRIRLMELGFSELSEKDHLLGITTMFWFVSFFIAFAGTLFFTQIWFYDIHFDHIVLICLVLGYVWILDP